MPSSSTLKWPRAAFGWSGFAEGGTTLAHPSDAINTRANRARGTSRRYFGGRFGCAHPRRAAVACNKHRGPRTCCALEPSSSAVEVSEREP